MIKQNITYNMSKILYNIAIAFLLSIIICHTKNRTPI